MKHILHKARKSFAKHGLPSPLPPLDVSRKPRVKRRRPPQAVGESLVPRSWRRGSKPYTPKVASKARIIQEGTTVYE